MDFLASLFTAVSKRPGPAADYWYQPYQPQDGTTPATPETALSISPIYRGVSVLANTLAMLPLPVYERLPDEQGKRKARDHRLWSVIHDRPNKWQTSFSWRQMGMGHVVLRGNFYNRIVSDARGFAAELIPLNPARTCVVDQLRDGRLVYEHTTDAGEQERLVGGEDMLHIAGFSSSGWDGLSVVQLMRRALDGAVNTESFAARLFSKAPLMRGFLKHPGRLDAEARRALEDSFQRANAGPSGWHRAPVLEGGMEWQSGNMMSAEDSQFLGTREFSVPEFARFIGVPTVLLMHADKTALYANAEQFFQSFLNFDIQHWFVNWETSINQALFTEDEQSRFYCEFNRDSVLRGDATSRAAYLKVMVGDLKVMSRNEARVIEGLNKVDGLDDLDEPEEEPPPVAEAMPAPPPQVGAIVEAAADRLVAKELAALRTAEKRAKGDADHWAEGVRVFYEKFVGEVSRTLALDRPTAAGYCAARREALLAADATLLDTWSTAGSGALVALVGGAWDSAPKRTEFQRDPKTGLVVAVIEHA